MSRSLKSPGVKVGKANYQMSGEVLHCTEHNVLFWYISPTHFVPWEGHGGSINKIVYRLDLI